MNNTLTIQKQTMQQALLQLELIEVYSDNIQRGIDVEVYKAKKQTAVAGYATSMVQLGQTLLQVTNANNLKTA